MSLLPKDQVLQVRLDTQLLDLFSQAAEARGMTVSACVRQLMRDHATSYQNHLNRLAAADRKRGVEASNGLDGVQVSDSIQKRPVAPPVAPEGPLAVKRRLEKEAKLRKMAARNDR